MSDAHESLYKSDKWLLILFHVNRNDFECKALYVIGASGI